MVDGFQRGKVSEYAELTSPALGICCRLARLWRGDHLWVAVRFSGDGTADSAVRQMNKRDACTTIRFQSQAKAWPTGVRNRFVAGCRIQSGSEEPHTWGEVTRGKRLFGAVQVRALHYSRAG